MALLSSATASSAAPGERPGARGSRGLQGRGSRTRRWPESRRSASADRPSSSARSAPMICRNLRRQLGLATRQEIQRLVLTPERHEGEGDHDRCFHLARQHGLVLAQHPERVDHRRLDRRDRDGVPPRPRAATRPAGRSTGRRRRGRRTAPDPCSGGWPGRGASPSPRARARDRCRVCAVRLCANGRSGFNSRARCSAASARARSSLAAAAKLADQAADTAEPRPRGRIARIFLHGLLVEIARDRPALRIRGELVGAQVSIRTIGRSPARRARAAAASRAESGSESDSTIWRVRSSWS